MVGQSIRIQIKRALGCTFYKLDEWAEFYCQFNSDNHIFTNILIRNLFLLLPDHRDSPSIKIMSGNQVIWSWQNRFWTTNQNRLLFFSEAFFFFANQQRLPMFAFRIWIRLQSCGARKGMQLCKCGHVCRWLKRLTGNTIRPAGTPLDGWSSFVCSIWGI